MAPLPDAQVLALVQAQAAARAKLTKQAVTRATTGTRSFAGWYDSAEITAWAEALARAVEGYQRTLAQTTDAYLSRVLTELLGRSTRPVGSVDVAGLRQGVTHAGAYGRVADVYRYQQSQWDAIARELVGGRDVAPPDLVTPAEAAVERAVAVATMDTQLAARAQAQRVMERHGDAGGITGYRRVLHPELSKGGSCGLCVAAADRVYTSKELLPIHLHCECATLPIVGDRDPGATLNRADLDRLYQRAGGTGQQNLAATRYQIDEHGELGPVLNPAGVKQRTRREVERDRNRREQPKSDAERIADITRIRGQLDAALPRARELATSDEQWSTYVAEAERRIADLDGQLAA